MFKFLSPTHFTRINFLPVHSNKNISHRFKKMAEVSIDNLMSGGYDAPQLVAKKTKAPRMHPHQNSKLYLGKVHTEEQINKLNDEEVDKLFNNYEAKLSGQKVKLKDQNIENQAGSTGKQQKQCFRNPLISMQKIGPKENQWNSNTSLNGKTS